MIVKLKLVRLAKTEVQALSRYRDANELPALTSVKVGGKDAYAITDEEIEAVKHDRTIRNYNRDVEVLSRGAKYVWSGGQQSSWTGDVDGDPVSMNTDVKLDDIVHAVKENKMVVVLLVIIVGIACILLVSAIGL